MNAMKQLVSGITSKLDITSKIDKEFHRVTDEAIREAQTLLCDIEDVTDPKNLNENIFNLKRRSTDK